MNKIKSFQQYNKNISQKVFYVGVVIETLLMLIDKSYFNLPFEGQVFRLTFLIFLIKVCLTEYDLREYILIALMTILGLLSWRLSGRNEVLRIIVFIAACKDVDMKKALKVLFWMTLSGVALLMILAITGVVGSVSITQDFGRSRMETRYVLGLGHPNALHCMIWTLIVLGLYLYAQKMKWFHYLLVMVLNIFFYILSGSRTSFLVTTITVAGFFLVCHEKIYPGIKKLTAVLGGIASLFSLLLSVLIAAEAKTVYDYDWSMDNSRKAVLLKKLDDLLSGRMRSLAGTTYFEGTLSTWRLMGTRDTEHFFDLGWVRGFYWYGYIPMLVFVVALILLAIYGFKNKKYEILMVMASISVYSIMEAHVVSPYLARNYLFFLIGAFWVPILNEFVKKKVS